MQQAWTKVTGSNLLGSNSGSFLELFIQFRFRDPSLLTDSRLFMAFEREWNLPRGKNVGQLVQQ